MKNKQTERELRPGFGLTRHLIDGVLCLAAISLICGRAAAQNLFAVGVDSTGGFNGSINEFTPNGVRSIFASGLTSPFALAFDSGGNLFVADAGSGAVYKFTPAGVRTTFALGLDVTVGLAFDSAGNLFATEFYSGHIYKFTPNGVRSTFASGLFEPQGLAFDKAGNLFVAAGGTVSKFTPSGVHTAFASGLTTPFALAFDSGGNLFVADGGNPWAYPPVDGAVYKFTPTGLRSTIASGLTYPNGLAIDSADNLFVADARWEQRTLTGSILKITLSGVRTTFASRIVAAMAFQPTQTPTPTPTATPTPIATPALPAVSLKASPRSVNKGGTATFTASASATNPFEAMLVNFSTSGNAGNGTDYTISGNQITIPAGQSSGSVTLQVITTKTKGKEKATMTLQPGTGYAVVTKNKANFAKVIIHNK